MHGCHASSSIADDPELARAASCFGRPLLAKEQAPGPCGSASTGVEIAANPNPTPTRTAAAIRDRENVDVHHCDEDRDERQERAEDRQFVSKIHGRADPPTVRRMLRRRVASVSEEPPLTARGAEKDLSRHRTGPNGLRTPGEVPATPGRLVRERTAFGESGDHQATIGPWSSSSTEKRKPRISRAFVDRGAEIRTRDL